MSRNASGFVECPLRDHSHQSRFVRESAGSFPRRANTQNSDALPNVPPSENPVGGLHHVRIVEGSKPHARTISRVSHRYLCVVQTYRCASDSARSATSSAVISATVIVG